MNIRVDLMKVIRVRFQLHLSIPNKLRLEQTSGSVERLFQDGGHLHRVGGGVVAVNQNLNEHPETGQLKYNESAYFKIHSTPQYRMPRLQKNTRLVRYSDGYFTT